MGVEIDSLEIKIQSNANEAAAGVDKLTAALRNLKAITKGGVGLTTVANQLSKLNTALAGVNVNAGKVGEVTKALNSLAGIQKASGLTSTINALKKLPAISQQLAATDLTLFAQQMTRVAAAVRPLATEMAKVSAGFSAFPARIQRLIAENDRLYGSNRRAGRSFGFLGSGLASVTGYYYTFKRIASVIGGWVDESTKYVENLNLFNVAMGESAQAAYDYAYAVREALGIDPAEWMRNQGVFKQITSGFGVVEEKANLMSKNLTQIGYDISSFFNISIADSMQKVQSGIAGELEPLRRLGYALDVATLQEIAYRNGINMKVNAMTQAQKSQLRYIAIMEQSGNVMGDMARTIMTPANAMRVLGQQITQLKRALGNLLIPAITASLPYVQAFVELLTEAIQRLAVLVGFELPEIDYSGVGGLASGAEDAEDALNGAAGAAKKLKNATLGIDELNILPDQTGGGGSGGVGGGDLGVDLPEYDFLGGLQEKTDEIKKKVQEFLGPLEKIGTAFAGWVISKNVLGWFKDLKGGKFKGIDKLSTGITLMIAGFTIESIGAFDIGYNGPNLMNVAATGIGAALGIAGSLLVFGTGPLGWAIGIGAALTVGISSFAMGYNKRQVEDEIKRRFGEIELSAEEIARQVDIIMTCPLTIKLDAYVDAQNTVDTALDNYLDSADAYRTLAWKMSVGIDVDQEQLTSAFDASLAAARAALDAQSEVYMLSIDIGLKDGDVKTDMALFADNYFTSAQSELDRLGKEMHDAIINGLSDGELGPEDMEAIANLQSEMNQIVQKMADAEYKAKLSAITLDAGGSLTYESTKAMMDDLQAVAIERINQLEGIRLNNLTLAELKFQEDGNKAAYDAAVSEIQKTFLEQSAELEVGPVTWGLDQFKQSFSDEVAASQEAFNEPVRDLIAGSFMELDSEEYSATVNGSISNFMDNISYNWKMSFNNLDVTSNAKWTLEATLAALEPSAEQLQKIADDAKAAGQKVPEYVAQGLQDYNLLAAVTGNVEAIDYLLGAKLSTDPAFLDALATANDAGVSIIDSVAAGLLDNVEIKNNADGTISLINDTIGEKVIEVTPTLVETLNGLGVSLSNGLVAGALDAMDGKEKDLRDLSERPMKIFKDVNKMGTDSPVFKEIGGSISDGLMDGINGKKSGLFTEIGNWAGGIIRRVKSTFEIHSPSAIFRDEVGLNLGLGIAEGLSNSTGSVMTAANSLMGGIQGAFSEVDVPVTAAYTDFGGYPNIASREELIRVMTVDGDADSSDQIAEGVRTGMAEQNALLRRQNEILLELLESGGRVYLDSREITGRQAEVSRMYGRSR